MTFPDTPTTQGLSLWCFNTVGGEILTFPDTPTTQGLSLWCFNTVERDFTDFARAPKVWRKDREVLMSLRNLFLLYFMTPACNFHGSGNDFMMYFVTPEHAISISGRIGSPFCCVA